MSDIVDKALNFAEIAAIAALAYLGYRAYVELAPYLKGLAKSDLTAAGVGLTGGNGGSAGLATYDWWWKKNHGNKRLDMNEFPGLQAAIYANPKQYTERAEFVVGHEKYVVYFKQGATWMGRDISGKEAVIPYREGLYFESGLPQDPLSDNFSVDKASDSIGNIFKLFSGAV